VDKKSVLALVVIAIIIVVYPFYMRWVSGGRTEHPSSQERPIEIDTALTKPGKVSEIAPTSARMASPDTSLPEKIVKAETDLYKALFSTRGGVLKSFVLKKFRYADNGAEIELIPQDGSGNLGLFFLDSSSVSFKVDLDSLVLNDVTQRGTITFKGLTRDSIGIIKRYTFSNKEYYFNLELEISGNGEFESKRSYTLAWSSGLAPTEKDLREDLSYFEVYCMMGQELRSSKKFKKEAGSELEILQDSNSGQTEWVATKTKYFLAAMVPISQRGSGFSAYGKRWFTGHNQQKIEHKQISIFLEMPIGKETAIKDSFMIYVGPLDYSRLKHYKIGLENTVSLGWKIIKPFSIAILWIFVNLHKVIPNYGLVIIIFTILMKVLFHPLTHKSTKSMSKMQQLQPKIAELKERHKDDVQRMNQEMMKLYKEHGVNPLGGCLPLLIQMPLFYGLFVIFRSTIELRGAEFIWWLKDLSQKDPYYILPLIMSVAMFWQQKITITDPKQKMMVYLMPILFFFLFKSFPAGLTLYWTLFNILSLIEQYYLKAKHTSEALSA
jgi:YidC/Oxa1 family membrane protein insertase